MGYFQPGRLTKRRKVQKTSYQRGYKLAKSSPIEGGPDVRISQQNNRIFQQHQQLDPVQPDEKARSVLERLPLELVYEICSFLPVEDLAKVSVLNKYMNSALKYSVYLGTKILQRHLYNLNQKPGENNVTHIALDKKILDFRFVTVDLLQEISFGYTMELSDIEEKIKEIGESRSKNHELANLNGTKEREGPGEPDTSNREMQVDGNNNAITAPSDENDAMEGVILNRGNPQEEAPTNGRIQPDNNTLDAQSTESDSIENHEITTLDFPDTFYISPFSERKINLIIYLSQNKNLKLFDVGYAIHNALSAQDANSASEQDCIDLLNRLVDASRPKEIKTFAPFTLALMQLRFQLADQILHYVPEDTRLSHGKQIWNFAVESKSDQIMDYLLESGFSVHLGL